MLLKIKTWLIGGSMIFVRHPLKSVEQQKQEIEEKLQKTLWVYLGAEILFVACAGVVFDSTAGALVVNVLTLLMLTAALENAGKNRRPLNNFFISKVASNDSEVSKELQIGNQFRNIINGGAHLFDKCTKF